MIDGPLSSLGLSVTACAAIKCARLDADCTLRVRMEWSDEGQRNAALVLASGTDADFMTLSEAQACLAHIQTCVLQCRAAKVVVDAILGDVELTDAEKIGAMEAVSL